MPIYEYRCVSCGHQKEYLQRVSDAPLTECPQCCQPTYQKMVTAAGFQLKGSGWYVTDFKNKGSAPKTAGDKAEPKKEEAVSEPKVEPACGAGACPACT
jgi:putative FmdB family regulatory protein